MSELFLQSLPAPAAGASEAESATMDRRSCAHVPGYGPYIDPNG